MELARDSDQSGGMKRSDGTAPTVEDRRFARVIGDRLTKRYPDITTALHYADPWQLLVATTISAQTTDENVNRVTPELFARYSDAQALAAADPDDVERIIYSTGFFRQKTKSIISLSQDLVDRFEGEVPADLESLITLRGVGRKTASVVLAEAFKLPAIAVDTHVKRVSNRLGISSHIDPVKIEQDLKAAYPPARWSVLSMTFIQFGRDTCDARKPRCFDCPLVDRCPYPDKNLVP